MSVLCTPALRPTARACTKRPASAARCGFARAFVGSATSAKALPSTLNPLRPGSGTTAPGAGAGADGVLRMVMFGKPGAGKGTLSARLVRKYDILSLSTGDLLRQHIAERTEVGRIAEEIVARGGLLPDEVMLQVLTSKLDLLHNKHWILDGFPRTLGQGQLLDTHLRNKGTPLTLIVNLDVPDDVILSRISDRWVHLPSGRVYNMSYNRPKVDGRDDDTGELLIKRPDDNPEIFARRLQQFYASTAPLLAFYTAQPSSAVRTLAGTTSDEIWPQLDAAVRGAFPALPLREKERRHSLSDAVVADEQKRKAVEGVRLAEAL